MCTSIRAVGGDIVPRGVQFLNSYKMQLGNPKYRSVQTRVLTFSRSMLVIAVGAAAAVSPRLAVVVAVVVLIITIRVTPPPSPSSSLFLATRYPSLAPALTLTLVGLAVGDRRSSCSWPLRCHALSGLRFCFARHIDF